MTDPYAAQWSNYRRRHWAASLGLLVGFPMSLGLGYLAFAVTGLAMGLALTLAALGWGIIWLWLCFRVTRFPCPRCDQPFLAGQEPVLMATRACSNCGLHLYADGT